VGDAADYLEPSLQAARQQWAQIARRADAPSGRQVVFTPVEIQLILPEKVFGRPPLRDRLVLPLGATLPGAAYLAWHHQHIYRSELPTG